MDLQQYLQIFRKYWRSILTVLSVCVGAALVFTFLQTPKYSSTSSALIAVDTAASAGELSSGALYAERQVSSFVALADSALVLDPVIDELGLDVTPQALRSRVSVSAPAGTSIVDVTVTDTNAGRAAEIANAITASLKNVTSDVVPTGPDGDEIVTVTVVEPASESSRPVSPRPVVNIALGLIAGVVLGLGQALVRRLLDSRIRTRDDLEEITDAPVLASVVHHKGSDRAKDEAAPARGTAWVSDESYRKLRTAVGFVALGGERRSSIVVTSSVQGEGKTETSTNLAKVLAETGARVLLVDADLRRPQVGARLGLDDELGLSDVLTGRADLNDVLLSVDDLSVLTAGTVPPNPSELLGSEAMAELLALVEAHFEYVILDAPPLLPVTDAAVLSHQAGGAVVVARAGVARQNQLTEALSILEAADASVYGVVLNDVPVSQIDGYSQYYR
ncbi:polysaccharide biosynthesis tyrosine autokinase [Micrococcus luteus]|uniref:polysaccharide biosynthesis tyrosine autokinase n=1 Tax=Micrococcus luteus TaxID=1270 RepID=UPI000769BDDD|nr:polysaccharide biosynthesis tyrosine autokinase [Micrococcus luteus]MCV7679268.1 polysaccharide biosynthesis tyrosine autokinase [Micrococcus luteus]MCV7746718.1 polysaccharide biosynthesis tyrosine autokinase [Micrococcus luteus]